MSSSTNATAKESTITECMHQCLHQAMPTSEVAIAPQILMSAIMAEVPFGFFQIL